MNTNAEPTADLNTRICGVEEEKPRKVVIARYDAYSVFIVPKEIDLEGPEIDEWFVKYDELVVYKKDGTKLRIPATYPASETDYKRPMEAKIENAEDYVDFEEE